VHTEPRDILRKTDHRPYPLPSAPWIMRETWSKVLLAHWSLPPGLIRPLMPPHLELDTFAEEAYISILAFRMSGVRLHFLPPIPGANEMLQINIRTYVNHKDKHGIYFLAVDSNHLLTTLLTRLALGLPYHHASISLKKRFVGYKTTVECISQRLNRTDSESFPKETKGQGSKMRHPDGALHVLYSPSSDVWHARSGSLEHWLTERYCLYGFHAGKLLRVDIHHHPWPLHTAVAEFRRQSLLSPLQNQLGFNLPVTPSLVHYAERTDALIWLPTAVENETFRSS
jgi:uncharacterized protein